MKNKIWIAAGSVVLILLAGLVVWTAYVSKPLYSEHRSDLGALPSVAPRDLALTFARSGESLLLVTGRTADRIEAIDLSALYSPDSNVLELYHAIGYDSLALLNGPRETFDINDLQLPLDAGTEHLAAGTNFAEHAEEVRLDDPPFLFPKLVKPTNWNAPVAYARRLDYEAELALVPLSDIHSPDTVPGYGLLLSNDFTDRWTLIRELRLREPMGTTGFAAAKGKESYLPAGFFFVIPKDDAFYREIELRLYVNDRLRQRFNARDMILAYEDIVQQAFSDSSMTYRKGDAAVELIPPEGIPEGSLILTGTAGGVIFKPVNIWHPGLYLKPGDMVRTEASYLGYMENRVIRQNRE